MIKNPPPRRPVYGCARTPDDRERKAQARLAAEALFTAKPLAIVKPVDGPARPSIQGEAVPAAVGPKPSSATAIPAAHLRCMRTWLKYGMTIAQVARIYGTGVDKIAGILRKV